MIEKKRRVPNRARFEVVDAINRTHGPFKTAAALRSYVAKRFRFQRQDEERAGRYPSGWDARVVGS